jgi:hypothetical protein
MTGSQNAMFTGVAPGDPKFDHPAGAGLARILGDAIAAEGWQSDEIDNWRDSGWSVRCRRGSADVEVVVAATVDPDEWFLQIAPHYTPGILARLFGRTASADVTDVLTLSRLAHSLLNSRGFRGIRWRWNGYPHEAQSTPAPVEFEAASKQADAADERRARERRMR